MKKGAFAPSYTSYTSYTESSLAERITASHDPVQIKASTFHSLPILGHLNLVMLVLVAGNDSEAHTSPCQP